MCLSTWNPRLVEDQEFEASMGLKSGSKQERQLSGWGSCPQVWQNEFSVQNLHGGKREQTRDLHTPRPCVHLHIFKYTHIKKSYLPAAATPGCGGAHLWQHLGGRGWQISEFEASLQSEFQDNQGYIKKPCCQKNKNMPAREGAAILMLVQWLYSTETPFLLLWFSCS